jgi:hypothetical protein
MPSALLYVSRLPPACPQGHALVIGISDYANLPEPGTASGRDATLDLTKVRCGALSALRFARWLIRANEEGRLPVPLGSVRLLLAPSAEEAEKEAELKPYLAQTSNSYALPNLEGIRRAAVAWRKECGKGQDRVAYYYFCGHGILRDGGTTTFLTHDFAMPDLPELFNAFDLNNVVGGMAPSAQFPEIARQQYYFLDCCQSISETLRTRISSQPSQLLSQELNLPDNRERPVFTASQPGGEAVAPFNEPTPFCEALLGALDAGGRFSRTLPNGHKIWPVRANDLLSGIRRNLVAAKQSAVVPAQLGMVIDDPEIVMNRNPPDVSFMLRIEPDGIVRNTQVTLSGKTLATPLVLPDQVHEHPYQVTLSAGIYSLEPRTIPDGPVGARQDEVVYPGFDLWVVRAQ